MLPQSLGGVNLHATVANLGVIAVFVKTLEEMRDGDRAADVRGAAHRSLTDALS